MSITCTIDRDECIRRMKTVDFICTDLDECLFPFYTQVLVAAEILMESFFKRSSRRYFWQLARGASLICFLMAITAGNVKWFGNRFLMKRFAHTMRGIPLDMISRHAQYVHTFFYAGSIDFLRIFAERKIPLTILSLSIQPILDVLRVNIGFIQEAVGNSVCVHEVSKTFQGYAPSMMSGPHDKMAQFQRLMTTYKAQCPLVIGHSKDEIPLVEYARAHGGLSIGINPKKKYHDSFDIVLKSVSWDPLISLADTAFRM